MGHQIENNCAMCEYQINCISKGIRKKFKDCAYFKAKTSPPPTYTPPPTRKRPAVEKETKCRFCEVNGEDAFFHRWAETESIIIKFNSFIPSNEIKRLRREYEDCGYIPAGVTTEKIKSIVAIVEFRDGRVAAVSPREIRFLDNVVFPKREDTKQ